MTLSLTCVIFILCTAGLFFFFNEHLFYSPKIQIALTIVTMETVGMAVCQVWQFVSLCMTLILVIGESIFEWELKQKIVLQEIAYFVEQVFWAKRGGATSLCWGLFFNTFKWICKMANFTQKAKSIRLETIWHWNGVSILRQNSILEAITKCTVVLLFSVLKYQIICCSSS